MLHYWTGVLNTLIMNWPWCVELDQPRPHHYIYSQIPLPCTCLRDVTKFFPRNGSWRVRCLVTVTRWNRWNRWNRGCCHPLLTCTPLADSMPSCYHFKLSACSCRSEWCSQSMCAYVVCVLCYIRQSRLLSICVGNGFSYQMSKSLHTPALFTAKQSPFVTSHTGSCL